jgi:hypothetical protein
MSFDLSTASSFVFFGNNNELIACSAGQIVFGQLAGEGSHGALLTPITIGITLFEELISLFDIIISNLKKKKPFNGRSVIGKLLLSEITYHYIKRLFFRQSYTKMDYG